MMEGAPERAHAIDPTGQGPAPARRRGLALLPIAALAAICLVVPASLSSTGCSAPPRPNVLFVVMDTTRADRCGFGGYARPTTPRLDAFAEDATVFLNAWSPSNWTGPAHASLFTGLVAEHHHGFNWRDGRPYLPPNWPTLAERFAAAGYDTACFTNNEIVSPEYGLVRGFRKVEPCYSDPRRPSTTASWAKFTHEDAATWVETGRGSNRPFFLFVNDIEPHLPWSPPPADTARFVRDATVPELVAAREYNHPHNLGYILGLEHLDPRQLALFSDLYDAEIAALDQEVGALLERLKSKGYLESTIVVIVGDHGELIGEHQIMGHSFGLYASLLRVPLILRFPGTFGSRRVSDVVRLEDVPPTLLEVCGLAPLDGIDGCSLTRDLPGRLARAYQPPLDVISVSAAKEFPRADISRLTVEMHSVYDGRRHLIECPDGRVELFDPSVDPDELKDLSRDEPDEVVRLKALLVPPR